MGVLPGYRCQNNDEFGRSVAFGDGVLAVGAWDDSTGGTERGAVYLIEDGGNNWADIVAGDVTKIAHSAGVIDLEDYDGFGTSVSFDGDVLAVGAPWNSVGATVSGAVYLIKDGGNDWADIVADDVTKLSGSTGGLSLSNLDYFGYSVSLVPDTTDGGNASGRLLAVGAYGADAGGTDRGIGVSFER